MREIDRALVDFLRNFARLMAKAKARRDFFYESIFELYLEEGVLANPEPYTDKEEKYLMKVFGQFSSAPKVKVCFYNAQTLALGESLLYAEGQVLHSKLPIPVEHGWNLLPSGKAVDVTLRELGAPNTCDPRKLLERARENQANAYMGLVIPAEEIRLSWMRTHRSLMLIEQRDIIGLFMEKGYPAKWRQGQKKFSAEPSLSGESVLGYSSGNFSAEPSLSEESGFMEAPVKDFVVEPALLEACAVLSGRLGQKYIAEPSLLEEGGYRDGSSKKMGAEPSRREYCCVSGSKKHRAEPSPRVSKPEIDWLNQPEREAAAFDSTRSHEGDVPPWGQASYGGKFPMRDKVFYITAYVGHGPERLQRSPVEVPSPVLGDARAIKNVGSMPEGIQFGSDFMFHPFAAIPVRKEDFSEIDPVISYLEKLLLELGAYGKILMEHHFPDAGRTEVRLDGGRWFPVDMTPALYGGIEYLNAYNVNRFYGGHEEGGWWYDAGEPVASVPLREEDPVTEIEWAKYLTSKVGWTSKLSRGNVAGHDDFEIHHEDMFAEPFPKETPRYQ